MLRNTIRRAAIGPALKICLGLGAVALLGLVLAWAIWSVFFREPASGGEGIILFDDRGRLFSIYPDGSGRKDFATDTKGSAAVHGTRLSPDRKRILYGERLNEFDMQGDDLYVRGLNDPLSKATFIGKAVMWWWPLDIEVLVVQPDLDGAPVNYLVNVETGKKRDCSKEVGIVRASPALRAGR